MKLTPKAKATLDFMEFLLSAGCPMPEMMMAANGYIGAIGLSRRDREALNDQFLIWQLAGVFRKLGIFGG